MLSLTCDQIQHYELKFVLVGQLCANFLLSKLHDVEVNIIFHYPIKLT